MGVGYAMEPFSPGSTYACGCGELVLGELLTTPAMTPPCPVVPVSGLSSPGSLLPRGCRGLECMLPARLWTLDCEADCAVELRPE
jgi:hypothetical protein